MRRRSYLAAMFLTASCWWLGPEAVCPAAEPLVLRASAQRVDKYEKIEFDIAAPTGYANPFDPAEVDLRLAVKTPDGRDITVPAFFIQPYERTLPERGPRGRSWMYPAGMPVWRARFAPMQTGRHEAAVVLADRSGTSRSAPVAFECVASASKGFLRASGKDPRWFEYTEGEPFFAIGQNLAFVGETQFATLARTEEMFGKLAAAGANYVRVWTCCEDWAMAVEARKSAWGRSWGGKGPIVAVPGQEDAAAPRRCVRLSGESGATLDVNPSHNVALRPSTRYVLAGRARTSDGAALQIESAGRRLDAPVVSAGDAWATFRLEFETGPNEQWLGRTVLRLERGGEAWIESLSLREAAGGPDLLWEADPNRPARGVYNPVDCFMLDEVVAAAEKNGLHLQLCLITRNLYMDDLRKPDSPEYDRAIRDAKNLLRYAVGRWGYSTAVAGWEYFNEQDPNLPTDRLYTELGEYLEAIDVYGHLRSTSTWSPSPRDWKHPKLDLADEHFYLRPKDYERLRDEVAAVLDRAALLRRHAPDKPALLGEFGLADEQWRVTGQMRGRAADMVDTAFHNSLWASSLSGLSGTGLWWWWDTLDPADHYRHYRPLADFLKDVPWTTAGLQPADVRAEGEALHVHGLCGRDRAYLWLFDPAASWASVVDRGQTPGEVRGARLELKGLAPGAYRAEWWETREGKAVGEMNVSVGADGVLRLAAPTFRRDLACKIGLAAR